MADRYPLIANSETNRIEELASGDNLNLQSSGIVGATTITSQKFVGNLEGIADFSNTLISADNILSGTISSQRLSGYYPIEVDFANSANAANIAGIVSIAALSGEYDIDITGTSQTANFLQNAANINEGIINSNRLSGVYNISITGTANSVSSIVPGTYPIDITGSSGYANISGVSTSTNNVNVSLSSTSLVVFPTFTTGIGSTNISIGSSLTYIPSTGRLGINTTSPNYSLDVRGDISLTNRIITSSVPVGVKTSTGTLNSSSFIGVDTSSLQIGDFVIDSPQTRIFNNTRVISIGSSIITVSPNHLVSGSEIRNLIFTRDLGPTAGVSGQVLVSGGASSPTTWKSTSEVVNIGVQSATDNQPYNLIFTTQTSGTADLRVDNPDLTFNPSSNILNVGGNVIASAFIGDGAGLIGIVTQISAGIGVNLTSTQSQGKGIVQIEAYRPTGKTIFVNQNGNDNNTGLSENHAKKTIKAAASIAVFGDTIKVFPGTYVEENPIVLKKTVSVEGTELRNCIVTPRYPYLDLFHVNNGCHITDMSFIGPEMTDGASVVALQPLEGVAVDRYFDAARMIRLNLDYIAAETVGYLTSTSYKNPTFTVVNSSGISTDPVNCKDDIKDIWKCVIHDITRGGNSRCVDAGLSYYNGNTLVHIAGTDVNGYSVRQATVDAINYSFNVARAIVNNVSWGGTSVGIATTVTNALYNNITGVTTITANNHGLAKDDPVRIVGLAFTCPSGPGIVTYPSGALGYIFNVLRVVNNNNFEVVVGQSTLPHTYVSGGTVQKFRNFQNQFTQVKDLGIQNDPLTGFNNAIDGCANVISAMHSCVGIVTNIVGLGTTAFSSAGIRTSYPGNSGIGFTSTIGITSAIYDEVSGKTTITAPGLKVKEGEPIELRDLSFSCSSGPGISTQKFPSGAYGFDFFIDKINSNGSFEIYVGPSTLPHTYVGGGTILDRTIGVTTATYSHTTGITTIRANGLSIETGDLVKIRGLEFSCPSGSGTTTIYPTGNNGFEFRVLDIVDDKPVAVTTAIYNNLTGITTITAPGIGVLFNSIVELRNLQFSCTSGAATTTLYPTGNNGYRFRVLSSIGSTFTVNVGPSTIPHTYVSGGVAINRTRTANDTFTINVGPSTIPHTYVSGGIVIPPFSRGVGPITQGPYVRNCTNFIPKSIGMKVDGFAAELGDQDDIGVTGTMSVDSYTQYNQGGIGVSITNGAYAQLVSIFTICDDIAIFTGSGGQCDITNSNSSFGRLGLFADGVGDAGTKSIYRSTGIAVTTALEKTNEVVISGLGNYRPYDGQVCYFGELYYFVDSIEIVDGGTGYSVSPRITISSPEGSNGITAQASSVVEGGKVVAINIVNSGTQYKKPPTVEIAPPGGVGTQATARISRMQPIYYKVDTATLPSAGISTVSFLQNLNNTVSAGTTIYFSRLSLQIASSHSFQWVGSGNDINTAKPALGGVVISDNEVVQENGGSVIYTSTDQAGNFKIGDGVIINQATGQISGRDFTKALFTTMTPFILALAE